MSLKLREMRCKSQEQSTFGPGDIAKGKVSQITLISIAFPNVDSYQTKDFSLSRLEVVQMKIRKVSFTQRERLTLLNLLPSWSLGSGKVKVGSGDSLPFLLHKQWERGVVEDRLASLPNSVLWESPGGVPVKL